MFAWFLYFNCLETEYRYYDHNRNESWDEKRSCPIFWIRQRHQIHHVFRLPQGTCWSLSRLIGRISKVEYIHLNHFVAATSDRIKLHATVDFGDDKLKMWYIIETAGSQKHGLISKEDVIKAFRDGSAVAGSAAKHAPSQSVTPVASTPVVHGKC